MQGFCKSLTPYTLTSQNYKIELAAIACIPWATVRYKDERLKVGFSTMSSSSLFALEAVGSGYPGVTVVSCVMSVYRPKAGCRLRSSRCDVQCWTVDWIYLESAGSTHCVQACGSWCSKSGASKKSFHLLL